MSSEDSLLIVLKKGGKGVLPSFWHKCHFHLAMLFSGTSDFPHFFLKATPIMLWLFPVFGHLICTGQCYLKVISHLIQKWQSDKLVDLWWELPHTEFVITTCDETQCQDAKIFHTCQTHIFSSSFSPSYSLHSCYFFLKSTTTNYFWSLLPTFYAIFYTLLTSH